MHTNLRGGSTYAASVGRARARVARPSASSLQGRAGGLRACLVPPPIQKSLRSTRYIESLDVCMEY
jgi:hypothetical protein